MPINKKDIHDTSEDKVSTNITIWVFALGLANDHDIHKKYENLQNISLCLNNTIQSNLEGRPQRKMNTIMWITCSSKIV